MKNFLSAIAAAIALASVPALAVSTHSKTVTNVVSVVIANAEHGMTSKYFGVHLYDASSAQFQPAGIVGYTYSIHPADFTVTVSLSNSFSGTVRLTGPFTGRPVCVRLRGGRGLGGRQACLKVSEHFE
jgi:surface antigen